MSLLLLLSSSFSTVERSAALAATGDITVSNFQRELQRSSVVGATADVTVSNFRRELQRSAVVAATADLTISSSLFFTIFERAARVDTAGTIAIANYMRELQRSSVIASTGTITAAHMRELMRSVSIGAIAGTASDGFAILERAASISATGSISVSAIFFSILERAVAIAATGSISVSAIFWTIFERTVAIATTAGITIAGVPTQTVPSYWGPHFPRGFSIFSYWDGHFPEGVKPRVIYAPAPHGVATLSLIQESGLKLTLEWKTDVAKFRDGSEKRASLRDYPLERYDGGVTMVDDEVTKWRSTIMRTIHTGAPFQLALPYDDLTLRAPATATIAYVYTTTKSDWINYGQRVLVVSPEETTVEGVIQSWTSDSITLYVTSGNLVTVGAIGGRVMPLRTVFLEGQQGFARYPNPDTSVEAWQVRATALRGGYQTSGVAAELACETLFASGNLDGLTFYAKSLGTDGNNITIETTADALTDGGELVEDVDAQTVHLKFSGSGTTLRQFVDLAKSSDIVGIEGDYDQSLTMQDGDDEISATNLAGGVDAGVTEIGQGVSVTAYRDKPIWDRQIRVDGTASDSVQALTEITQYVGVPSNFGTATRPDWGRQVSILRNSRDEYQWLRRFLHLVKGRWKSWWLPTYRADLVWISTLSGSAAVKASLPLELVAHSGNLDSLTIRALVAGVAANLITVQTTADALTSGGEYTEDVTGLTIEAKFSGEDTTPTQFKTLINGGSALVEVIGTAGGGTVATGDDEFGPVQLFGGRDAVPSKIKIDGTRGQFFDWYPKIRDIQVVYADNSAQYVRITDAVQNSDDTITLSVDDGLDDGQDIVLISWIELVRLESDEVNITFSGPKFEMEEQARVVQR